MNHIMTKRTLLKWGAPIALTASALAVYLWPVSSDAVASQAPRPSPSTPFALKNVSEAISAPRLIVSSTPVVEQVGQTTQAAAPTLVGIAGQDVWLKSAASGEIVRLSAGQTLDGWRIARVTRRAVTVELGQSTETLSLLAEADAS